MPSESEVETSRRCRSCREVRPITRFGWTTKAHTARRGECEDCNKKRSKASKAEWRAYWAEHDPYEAGGEKRCLRCEREKPVSDFSRDSNAPCGLQKWCRRCSVRVYQERTYGRAVEEDDVCAICGTDEDLCVDHDHATTVTRDVLCRTCNYGLGNFGDDPERLLAAAAYLIAHRDREKI